MVVALLLAVPLCADFGLDMTVLYVPANMTVLYVSANRTVMHAFP